MVEKNSVGGERFFLKLILFFFSVSCAVVTADIFFQWYWKIPSSGQSKKLIRYVETELPKKRLQPNLNVRLTGAYREYQYEVSTDKNGFRKSTPYALNRTEDYRVVLLGDSQTFGAGVNDDQTFASVLSSRLNEPVLNAGVPGYNNIEALQLARVILNQFKPKIVILCFYVGNDPYENFRNRKLLLSQQSDEGLPHAKKKEIKISIQALKNFLKRHSALYNGFARLRRFALINDFFYRFGLVDREAPNELVVYRKHAELKETYWKITEDVIRALQLLTIQNNTQLLVLFIPDRLQIDREYKSQWIAKYKLDQEAYDFLGPNRHLSTFCKNHSIPFLDVTELLQKNHLAGNKPFWTVDHHLSSVGHQMIGESISHYLENNSQFLFPDKSALN